MIAILLASPSIDSGSLHVAIWIGAEPRIFIGRRQPDTIQPIDFIAIRDPISFGVEIGPVSAHALARDAGLGVTAMPKHFRGQLVLLDSSTVISEREESGFLPCGPKEVLNAIYS